MDNQALAILVAVTLFGALTIGIVTTKASRYDEDIITSSSFYAPVTAARQR